MQKTEALSLKGLKMEWWSIIKDVLIAVMAVIGASLGIMNTYRDKQRDKVKLRVSYGMGMTGHPSIKSNAPSLTVSVTNLSSFAVSWDHVTIGLTVKGDKDTLTVPEVSKQLPKRIEPRTKETVLFPNFISEIPDILPLLEKATHLTVSTACGHTEKIRCNFDIYGDKHR